ncbi:hypothetical protein V1512DRAFT_265988 [Lipomyces arxii]|uniref:uncharacterized protein n=1 Tax=Lipomyces arxii TaxID=56418 RepID=UPI0034CF7177
MAEKDLNLYVYSLPKQLLDSLKDFAFAEAEDTLQLGQETSNLTPSSDSLADDRLFNQEGGGNSCNICQIVNTSPEDQREHFKSDLHRYNVKRKLIRLPPVTTDEFEKSLEELDESISGSGEESDTDEVSTLLSRTRIDELTVVEDYTEVAPIRSPYHLFTSPLLPADSFFAIYRALFPTEPGTVLNGLKAAQFSTGVTAIFMIGGGHFAGAIVSHILSNNRGSPVQLLRHKTFHRYTTRRKQGGSQSASDNAHGKASSAGASLRRYNEAALEKEISELMLEWKDFIDKADHVFIRASGKQSRSILFQAGIISANDSRVRNVPFITRRATGKEVKRVWMELTKPKVLERKLFVSKPKPKPVVSNAVEKEIEVVREQTLEEQYTSQIVAMVKRSRTNPLKLYLDSNSITVNFRFEPQDQFHHTPTALHLAASLSLPRMVLYLLVTLKADPTIANAEGRMAWDLSGDRTTRDAFRLARGDLEEIWNWDLAKVPVAITKADIERREAQEQSVEQEKREKAVNRLQQASNNGKEGKSSTRKTLSTATLSVEHQLTSGLSAEARMKIERERRARAVEARMNLQKKG